MSIAEEGKNINSGTGKSLLSRIQAWIAVCSGILGVLCTIGLGILWGRVNQPAPITIECSDEVLKGLKATSTVPILHQKEVKSTVSKPKKQTKPKATKKMKI
jgi:hypothetical protein